MDVSQESRELVTSLSEIVLCFATIRCAYYGHYSWEFPAASVAGFTIIAIAAGLGFFRFGKFAGDFHAYVAVFHDLAAYLSAVTGIALIAQAYLSGNKYVIFRWLLNGTIAVGCLGLILPPATKNKIKTFAGPLPVFTIIFLCVFGCGENAVNYYGIIGCACIIFGGIVIGTKGKVFHAFKAVDVFHFFIAAGFVMLAGGIRWKMYNCT